MIYKKTLLTAILSSTLGIANSWAGTLEKSNILLEAFYFWKNSCSQGEKVKRTDFGITSGQLDIFLSQPDGNGKRYLRIKVRPSLATNNPSVVTLIANTAQETLGTNKIVTKDNIEYKNISVECNGKTYSEYSIQGYLAIPTTRQRSNAISN